LTLCSFSIVAVPLLMIIVLSQFTPMRQETEVSSVPSPRVDDYVHAAHNVGCRQSSTACPADYVSYGDVTEPEAAAACASSRPVVSTSPLGKMPCQHEHIVQPAVSPPGDQDDTTSWDKNVEPASVSKDFALFTSVALVGPPVLSRRDGQKDSTRYEPDPLQDPFRDYVNVPSAATSDKRKLASQAAYNVFLPSNTSRVTRLVELSLAMTTAMDRAIRTAHGTMLDILAKYDVTWTRTGPIRNSGRRIFNSHFGGLFNETDALKQRLRTEMSELLDTVDHHYQDLSVEVDKRIQQSKEGLVKKLKETADALEKHIGVEIPLPASMARDPGRNRTKPTVSTWAEKFWQTLHHVSPSLHDWRR
jgi:hypothetical protein